MKLRKALLILIGVWMYAVAHSQNTCDKIFSGQILDDANLPLEGVAVFIGTVQKGILTDVDGKFSVKDLCVGKYAITITYLGYQQQQLDILVDDNVTKTIQLIPATAPLQEVVVTEQVKETEHAQNYTVIDEKQLAENAGKSLGETLRNVSGVNTIQSGPGIFKPVIHGVHSQRVLILNDGVRQEGQQWGAEHAPEIDPFAAAEIVVVKDASSIKYGTDALGGVVIINPPALPDHAGFSGGVHTVYQSNGRAGVISGLLEGGIHNHDGWGWRVQGTAKRTGDFQTPTYSLTNTGIKEFDFSTAAGYHKEKFGFEVYFSRFQSEIGILKGTSVGSVEDLQRAMTRNEPLYTSSFSYNVAAPRQEIAHSLLKLNGHIKIRDGDISVQYAFQNDHRKEFSLRVGDRTSVPTFNFQLNTHTLEAEVEKVKEDKRSFCFGISGLYQQNSTVYGTQVIPFIPNYQSFSAGLFAISKFYFNRTTLDVGVRYDFRDYQVTGYDYKNTLFRGSNNFQNASATFGTTVRLGNAKKLIFNVSSAWRPPHVSELYSLGRHQSAASIENGLLLDPLTNEVRDLSATNFKTENALKFVSTYQQAWKNFSLEVSPYINYIFNYIYLKPEGVRETIQATLPSFRYTQTDASFIGADITGKWQVTKFIAVSPKASLLRVTDEKKSDYLIFIPSNHYDVLIRYERPFQKTVRNVYLESRVMYVDQQRRAPRVITPSDFIKASESGTDPLGGSDANFDFMAAPKAYALWNLAAGISVRKKKTQYDFRISSENTLNTIYRDYTNRLKYYANDLGRNLTISAKCIF